VPDGIKKICELGPLHSILNGRRGCAALLFLLCCPLLAHDATPKSGTTPAAPPQLTQSTYVPITPKERLNWFVRSTAGPESLLLAGPFSAGWGTAFGNPPEYNNSWEGFGQRYGMRLTGVSTGNAMEAGFGAIWGEDPRYFRAPDKPFKKRVVNVIDLTFRAYHPDGERHFAYARSIGNVGNNFLSNTWRVPSESDWQSALIRCLGGIGGRAASNAFKEFLPDVIRLIRRKPNTNPSDASPAGPGLK
jgi:hypothetical protein